MSRIKLLNGDNLELLKTLPENSIDSVVTDGPYGLSFMQKRWDYDVPSVEFWREVFRVLKPGGHVLSFGGTRTYHRMTVNIEDAGFEIRDQIMWLYGSGFPKSHNIGKSVDKIRGNEREVVGERLVLDMNGGNYKNTFDKTDKNFDITKGTSEWEGWGTALKPANEPICVARKPLSEKTIADNVLKWGTGGINIDGCRVELNGENTSRKITENKNDINVINSNKVGSFDDKWQEGRFPANVILDEEAGKVLDEQSGVSKSSKSNKQYSNELYDDIVNVGGGQRNPESTYSDKGGASRFFYCPKVSKKERNAGCDELDAKTEKTPNSYKDGVRVNNRGEVREATSSKNNHPTVKPISLMSYLVRLVTPPNGVVLDAFMGSGSTGCAAIKEGFRFVGMEMDQDYFEIAKKRIEYYEKSDENVNEEKTSRASDEG